MTYVDVTLTPAATYTYVHNGQIYNQIASTLAAHGNWQYVEYVDATSGGNTYRRHVWKCKAAGSGLPTDFFIIFQTQFVTATGVYSTTVPVSLGLAEGYASGTLSKIASTKASISPASDLTNPATWVLTTLSAPNTVFWPGQNSSYYSTIGPKADNTSVRLLYIVAKDGLMSNWGQETNSSTPSGAMPVYAGAYDSLLGGTADPMPLVLFCSVPGIATVPSGGATRAPLQTAGSAVTEVFSTSHSWYPGSLTNSGIGNSGPQRQAASGTLGSPAVTTWAKSDGGVQVYRCYLSSYTYSPSTNSTKGIVRGYSKYVRAGSTVATHSMGDTFLIDGKVYVGMGSAGYGLWDTEAS